MSISSTYPDKKSEANALLSTSFSEQLQKFDLEHLYIVLVESEIELFYFHTFGIDIYSSTDAYDDIINKGELITREADNIIFEWDNIPVLSFIIEPDYDFGYGHIIRCSRLYDIDEQFCS